MVAAPKILRAPIANLSAAFQEATLEAELEALEKLVEKVGRIDLHAGAGAGGFDALLQNLYSLRERADAVKPA